MSNWAENPQHQRTKFEKYALPYLYHSECPKDCVNDLSKAKFTESEMACISNC